MARLATGQTISPEGTAMAARMNQIEIALKAHSELTLAIWGTPPGAYRDRLVRIDCLLHHIIEDYELRGMLVGEDEQV